VRRPGDITRSESARWKSWRDIRRGGRGSPAPGAAPAGAARGRRWGNSCRTSRTPLRPRWASAAESLRAASTPPAGRGRSGRRDRCRPSPCRRRGGSPRRGRDRACPAARGDRSRGYGRWCRRCGDRAAGRSRCAR